MPRPNQRDWNHWWIELFKTFWTTGVALAGALLTLALAGYTGGMIMWITIATMMVVGIAISAAAIACYGIWKMRDQ